MNYYADPRLHIKPTDNSLYESVYKLDGIYFEITTLYICGYTEEEIGRRLQLSTETVTRLMSDHIIPELRRLML